MSDLETTNELSLSEVIDKSREFGRRHRELEDAKEFEAVKELRREWRHFSDHLHRNLRRISLDAYYDEYRREPADGEYKEESNG